MLNVGRAEGTYPGRLPSDTVANIVLAANTEQHFNVPALATVAVFSATANFYVLNNGQTAAVPSVTDVSFPSPNTDPELNPTVYSVKAGTLISIVAPATTVVTISFYRDHDV